MPPKISSEEKIVRTASATQALKHARNKRHKKVQKVRKAEVQKAFIEIVEFLPTILPRNNHEGTSSEDIERVCRMQFEGKFKGIFAANNHPNDMSEGYYIINTDPFQLPGMHWTAVAGVDGETVFYDSFDRKSTQLFPEIVLPGTGKDQSVRQRIKESNCGERCIAFLCCVSEFGIHSAKKHL